MRIRDFRPDDATTLAALFHASVREVGIRGYSAEQVAAWSPAPPDPAGYLRRDDGRAFLVAVDDEDVPLGYGDLEPDGHLDHLFCRPDVIGKGVGSALIRALEQAARRSAITMIYVEASEVARPVFERHGFEVECRREFERHGVPMHNYRMVKQLAAAGDAGSSS